MHNLGNKYTGQRICSQNKCTANTENTTKNCLIMFFLYVFVVHLLVEFSVFSVCLCISSFFCDLLHGFIGLQCAELSGPPMVCAETMCSIAQEKLWGGVGVLLKSFLP